MKTVVMYVGNWKPAEIVDIFRCTVSGLENEGVEILDNTSESLMVIQTPKTYIMFIDDTHKFQGRVFDEIFGDLPEKFILGRRKHPEIPRYNGSVIDYVVRCEYGRRLI